MLLLLLLRTNRLADDQRRGADRHTVPSPAICIDLARRKLLRHEAAVCDLHTHARSTLKYKRDVSALGQSGSDVCWPRTDAGCALVSKLLRHDARHYDRDRDQNVGLETIRDRNCGLQIALETF